MLTTKLVVTALAGALTVGGAAAPADASVRQYKSIQYTVCNFSDPTVPSYNAFPFSKDITTSASTSNAKVRKAVESVQELLRWAGFTNRIGGPVLVDGDYGPATAYAVKQFQRRYNLPITGKVGPKTWQKMGSEYCWLLH